MCRALSFGSPPFCGHGMPPARGRAVTPIHNKIARAVSVVRRPSRRPRRPRARPRSSRTPPPSTRASPRSTAASSTSSRASRAARSRRSLARALSRSFLSHAPGRLLAVFMRARGLALRGGFKENMRCQRHRSLTHSPRPPYAFHAPLGGLDLSRDRTTERNAGRAAQNGTHAWACSAWLRRIAAAAHCGGALRSDATVISNASKPSRIRRWSPTAAAAAARRCV